MIMRRRPVLDRLAGLAALLAIVGGVLGLGIPIQGEPPAPAFAQASNPIVVENQQPGSTGWQIAVDGSGTPLKAAQHEIEGYASLTSVNNGSSIDFKVSLSSAAQYTIDVYRMG